MLKINLSQPFREDEFLRREEKFKTHINKLEEDLNMIKLKVRKI